MANEQSVRQLVDSITDYDFVHTATAEITGENREFQEAVIAVCLERQCEADVPTIKK